MLEIIDMIKENLEDVKMFKLTQEQKDYIDEHNNTYIRFDYGITDKKHFVFYTTKDKFKKMEYNLGFEYERDDIQCKIELGNDIIIVYHKDNERVTKLFEYLMPDEFCED